MKPFLSFILLFISFSIFGQVADIHPDEFKSNSMFKQKSDYQLYYNPLLDKYDIHFLKLDLNVTDQSTYIFGNATIVGKAQGGPLDTLVFDFKDNMIVDSMLINGINRVASRSNNEITSIFSPEIPDGEEFNVQVYYHGTPSGDGVSSYLSSTWGKRVTWTLSESFHAYEWWPCKQVLSDKIDSAYLFFTCDDDCMVGSNGLLRNVTSLPNNKERYEWKTYHPINYYLISFAVAEYQDYSIYANPVGSDPVLIQNFIYNHPNCLANYKSEIDQTASFIELFSEKFGLYPFADEKYGHCLALLGGGMEHQTMTTLNSFSYNLVSHELAHQWFGDYVTCASWQDIWINEGFASYCEYIALENLSSYSTAQSWLTNAYSQAMQSPTGSVYIPFENAMDEGRIFSGSLSYKKGAALLHMIRYQINNDNLFYLALQNYLTEYKNSVATGEDFKNSIEETTQMDFDLFFDQWYYGKGHPTINIGYSQTEDTLTMKVTQRTTTTTTPLFNMYIEYKINYQSSDTVVRLYQDVSPQTYKIPIKEKVRSISVDPNNKIMNGSGVVVSSEELELVSFSFEIYPNPAEKTLNISLNGLDNNSLKTIEVYNLSGILVVKKLLQENESVLDISEIVAGIYTIRISGENGSVVKRFIKK